MSLSTPAGSSTGRRLTARRGPSQEGPALSRRGDGDNLLQEQSGQDGFADVLQPPLLDDPDNLSYEASSDGGAPPVLSDPEESDGDSKGKEKAGEKWNTFRLDEGEHDDIGGENYDSYSDEDDVEEEERPNRFRGASTTWMDWTRRERQEITALEKIRARDLSLHLFNTFALKKRAKRIANRDYPATAAAATPTTHGFGGEATGEDAKSPFAPPKYWTAWPMPPEIVPRVDESRFRDETDLWTMRMEPDARPSAELEECIMAQMLQAAKDKFNARQWDSASGEPGYGGRQGSTRPVPGREDANGNGDVSDKEQSGFESGGDGDLGERVRPPSVLKPVVLADDEKARSILRPAARYVLTRFDELLKGLHLARQAYITMGGGLQGDVETGGAERPGPATTRRKRKRPSSLSGADSKIEQDLEQTETEPRSQGSSPNTRTPPAPEATSARNPKSRRGTVKGRTGSGQMPGPQTASQAHRQEMLGLRDWSDVLGVASMTGYAQPAIMRAAHRCAQLFDEDMAFRTMDEGRVHLDQTGEDGPVWRYTEDDEAEDEGSGKKQPSNKTVVPEYIGKLKEYSKFCPVEECPRHTKGFLRTWNLNKHLKTKHPDLVSREMRSVKVENGNESVA